jgi:peptidyl-prolyl cis-trans isomerase A (cyclophilin A)
MSKKKRITQKSNKNITFKILGVIAIVIIIALAIIFISKPTTEEKTMIVTIETSMGNIDVQLNQSAAPITVTNFLSYVDESFYDGLVFHRVIDGFMIQGGGFTPDGKQKTTKAPIILESNNGLKNNRGTIAMARTNAPNSATSQFFINTVNNDFLNKGSRDDGYAVFGEVVSGMDVVDKIQKVQTKPGDWPVQNITILSIKRK